MIAAAPDLVEAVSAFINYLDAPDFEDGDGDYEQTLFANMRAAIAKARGNP